MSIKIGIGRTQIFRGGGDINWSSFWTQLLLTSTGTGAGVSTLTMESIEETTVTLGTNAKFYSDAAGTLDESATWIITPGADRTIYLKCTIGTATMNIQGGRIKSWTAWTSTTNAASIGGDCTHFINMTYFHVYGFNTLTANVSKWTEIEHIYCQGSNTLTGDISGLTSLTYLNVCGYFPDYGLNTLSGNASALPLTYVRLFGNNTVSLDLTGNHTLSFIQMHSHGLVTGDITGCVQYTYLDVVGDNPITGSLTNFVDLIYLWLDGCLTTVSGDASTFTSIDCFLVYGKNTITGDISGLTTVKWLDVLGNNTLSGDIAALTLLGKCRIQGASTVTYSNATLLTKLSYLSVHNTVTLTSANVNQLLADFWLNRNEAKDNQHPFRFIDIQGKSDSGKPTGQGLIDKDNLRGYNSHPATSSAFWTVITQNDATELIDQANWYKAAYWNLTFAANWAQDGTTLKSDGGTGSIMRDAFWEVGATYLVRYTTLINEGTLVAPYDGSLVIDQAVIPQRNAFLYTPTDVYLRLHSALLDGSITELSIKKILSVELATNGEFTDGTGWVPVANWTISGGKANYDKIADGMLIDTVIPVLVTGKKYRISVDTSNLTSGTECTFWIYDRDQSQLLPAATQWHPANNVTAVKFATLVDDSNGCIIQGNHDSPDGAYSLDNFSVKEVLE